MSGAEAGRLAIRPASPADIDALLELEEEAFESDRLDRRAFRHALRSATILALVAETGGRPAGYCLVQFRRGSRVARLTSVAVLKDVAGRGIGHALVDAAEKRAREQGCDRLRLEVRADNEPARRLYEAAGYGRFGELADYYEDGQSAWRYEKPLR